MTNSVQKDYKIHADPAEPSRAKVIDRVTAPDGSEHLELQVSSGDPRQNTLLTLDDIREFVPTDPGVVEELRLIRATLDRIAEALEKE